MKKSMENAHYLKKKLFRFDFKKGISINKHLNSFNKILVDLKNLDVTNADDDKALLLLNSLLESYDHLTSFMSS